MRKMDEMEWKITVKGIKWSYLFLVASLIIWGVYNYITRQVMTLPLLLVTLQFLVFFFVTNIAKGKADDDRGKKQLFIAFGIVCLLLLLGAILYYTVGR